MIRNLLSWDYDMYRTLHWIGEFGVIETGKEDERIEVFDFVLVRDKVVETLLNEREYEIVDLDVERLE